MKALAVWIFLGVGVWAIAQTGSQSGQRVAPHLRQDELYASIDKADAALRATLKLPPGERRPAGMRKTATRAEVVAEFERLFKAVEPRFTYTPRPFKVDSKAIERFNQGEAQSQFRRLIRWGCVAPVGPLVVGPQDSISVGEYGDALGMFLMQLAALTHMPDPKFTPHLQAPDDEPYAPVKRTDRSGDGE